MANPTDAFFSSQTGTGEYKSVIAWLNFYGISAALSTETVTNNLPGQYNGYTISFDLIKDSNIRSMSAPYQPNNVAFGLVAYQAPNPSPLQPAHCILEFRSTSSSGDSSVVKLTNIMVRDPLGMPINNYKIVVTDAQFTVVNNGQQEYNDLVTNGGNWQLIEMINTPPHTTGATPIITGACTSQHLIEIADLATPSLTVTRAPVVSTISPTEVTITLGTISAAGGAQAVAVGIILFKEPETPLPKTYNFYVCPDEKEFYFDLPYSGLCGGNILQYQGASPLPVELANGVYSPIYSYNNDNDPLLTGLRMTVNNTLTDKTTDTLIFSVSNGTSPFTIEINVTFSSEQCDYLIKKEVTTRIIDSTQVPAHIFGKDDIFTYMLTFWNKTIHVLPGYEVYAGVYGMKLSDILPKGLYITSAITCTTNDVPQSISEFSSIYDFDGTNYGYIQSITPDGNRLIELYLPPTQASTKEVISIPVMKDISNEIKPNDIIDNTYSIISVGEKTLISDKVQTKYSICDIIVEKTAEINAYPKKDYTYTIKLTNVGNLVAQGLRIIDTLPSDFKVNDLSSGKDITITDRNGNPVSDFYVDYTNNTLIIHDPPGVSHVLNQNDFFLIRIRGKFD